MLSEDIDKSDSIFSGLMLEQTTDDAVRLHVEHADENHPTTNSPAVSSVVCRNLRAGRHLLRTPFVVWSNFDILFNSSASQTKTKILLQAGVHINMCRPNILWAIAALSNVFVVYRYSFYLTVCLTYSSNTFSDGDPVFIIKISLLCD